MATDKPMLLEEAVVTQFHEAIRGLHTFETKGMEKEQAIEYLESPEGEKYRELVKAANPDLSPEQVSQRALSQIQSGRTLPTIEVINEPLVKIVKPGAGVSPHTPYFAKLSDLEARIASGESLSNKLGLPIASESPYYDVYVIRPKGPVEVFVSEIAPTSELDGRVQKEGGARPYRAPRRRHLLDDGMTTC